VFTNTNTNTIKTYKAPLYKTGQERYKSTVCLLARLLKNACMYLDEMLRVDMWEHGRSDYLLSPIRILVRMPEPDCFLRYCISDDTRNFTSGKSVVYVLASAATCGFTMVLFAEPVSRRNTFVGGTCAPPSALLVRLYLRLPIYHCVQQTSTNSAAYCYQR